MSIISFIAAAGLASLAATQVLAANEQLSGGRVIESVTAPEIAEVYAGTGWQTEIRQSDATSQAVVVRTETGFVFVVMLRACTGAPMRCTLVQPYAQWEPANITLNQVNAFNFQTSKISAMMMLEDGSTLLGAKFYMNGGVTAANLRTNLGIFLADIDLVLQGVKPGARADVAFAGGDAAQGYALKGASGIAPADLPAERNVFGVGRPGISQDAIDAFLRTGD